MIHFKDTRDFLAHYQTFLQINTLLYHPTTCPYTEPTPLYVELIEDLLLYIDTMKEEEKNEIENSEQTFGRLDEMHDMLLTQLERLEEHYDLYARHVIFNTEGVIPCLKNIGEQ